jgi:hypothetical protein
MNLGDIAVYDTVRVWAEGFMEAGLGPAIVASATCGIATGVYLYVCVCMHEWYGYVCS